ncbi:MAG: CHASE3 domain-containing protein [Pelomonas sp.]|nr:CHASE3 domain-containing protein [Roseateles sp.]
MFDLDPLLQQASRRRLTVLVASLVAALLMVISEAAYHFAGEAVDSVRTRNAARFDALLLRSLMADAETAQRGFLITGRDTYLQPMQVAEARLPEVIQRLSTQYQDPEWAALVAEARQRAEEKLSELRETVKLYRAGSHQAWQAIMATDIGREKMDALRVATERLDAHEQVLLERDRDAIFRALLFGRFGVHVLTLLSLLWLLYFLRRNEALHAARREHAQILRVERDRLEHEVRRRTAELTDLARHLQNVREDERAHLARELHDELGALLTAAKLDVARVRRLVVKGETADIVERLGHMAGLIDEGITLKRRIIEDLRPSALANLGLTPALEILAREFGERSGLTIETSFAEVDADAGGKLAIYRLVQEALTNVLRHAQARQVWVTLRHDGAQTLLSVRDDGRGFDPAAVPAGHHGLLGMRYRMESLGGTLRLASAPGQGTEVEARVPDASAVAAPAGAPDAAGPPTAA